MPDSTPEGPRKRRRAEPDARRQSILDAGLAVFAAEGFAAAKLDEVAAKAGIAKGTIYLHFRDKQDLFEQIVRSAIEPVLKHLEDIPDLPIEQLIGRLFATLQTDILATDRKLILRLVLTEGHRFPEIAEFYHREVIAKAIGRVRPMIERAVTRGEQVAPDLARFPQLLIAPALMVILWEGLFAKFEPLDIGGLMKAHRDILLGTWMTGAREP